MSDESLIELEKQLLQLPQESRASLGEKLICSLEAQQHTEAETAWIEEVERCYEAIQRGKVNTLNSDEVFRSIR